MEPAAAWGRRAARPAPAGRRPGFVRIRTPYVADQDAARVAEQTAHLVRHPAQLLEDLTGRTVVELTKTDPDDDGSMPLAA